MTKTLKDPETCSICLVEVENDDLNDLDTGERVCYDCLEDIPHCEDCFENTYSVRENHHGETLCPQCWRGVGED